MNYISTRLTEMGAKTSAAQAIKTGLAADGGLFMPEKLPSLSSADFDNLAAKSYPERAADILSRYLDDYTYEELLADCNEAYSEERFPGGAAPVVPITDNIIALELWHGPTCAFKDMALQIMPRLLSRALKKTGEERRALILVATSGDTGKAALEGYRDVPNIDIQVFYPVDGVSRIQKLQMATQEGNNVDVCAIRGNFDDAQNGVKSIFSDKKTAQILSDRGYFLSSANSINWGRLAPQIVYYVSAYCDMVTAGMIKAGESIDICVPTGNFGNIFAAYLAKLSGLPVNRLICASNRNNILTDFLKTGIYDRNRHFYTTTSPSMDILISSNLERLLYLTAGAKRTADYMKQLAEEGRYEIDADVMEKIRASFTGFFCDEEGTAAAIKETFHRHGYLLDTHTAVGYHCAKQYQESGEGGRKILLASTASPYKFAADVLAALTDRKAEDTLNAPDALHALTGTEIPVPLRGLAERVLRFDKVVDRLDMLNCVLEFASAGKKA
ncbi:MAG: threonine synthase [Clostridiales bacterium]|nr:threonine synthase [Clostridiales bacterium]